MGSFTRASSLIENKSKRGKIKKIFLKFLKIIAKKIGKFFLKKDILKILILLLLSILLSIILGPLVINFLKPIIGYHIIINPQIGEFFEKIAETGRNVIKTYQEYMQCLLDPWGCPRINPYKNIKTKEAKEVIEKQYGIHILNSKISNGYTNPTLLYYDCDNNGRCVLDSKNSSFSQSPYIFTYLKLSFPEPKDVKIKVLLKYVENIEMTKEQSPCEYYSIISSKDKVIFEEALQNVKETFYPLYISLDFEDFDFGNITSACSNSEGYFKGDNENIIAQFGGIVNDVIIEASYNYTTLTDTYILLVRSEACIAAELEGKTIFDYLGIDPEKYLESIWTGDRGVYAAVSSPIAETGNYICIDMDKVNKREEYPIYLYIVFRKIDEEAYIKNILRDLQIYPSPEKGYEILGLSDEELINIINEKGFAGYMLILNYSSNQLLNLFEGRDFIEVKISVTTRGRISHKFNLGRLRIFNQ